ncbi:hypothetical protein ACFYNO_31385 [Kitasatospora sp. NPDC006697]|uniref:hypothetical protein n=1 Tax=Kitasatospora sp. NPDC006697 TaxID=3364020 RepID=UPI0036A5B4F8
MTTVDHHTEADRTLLPAAVELARSAREAGNHPFGTSTEPCAMCAGAVLWSGIGRVGYPLGGEELVELTGGIPVLTLSCREVPASGPAVVQVVGPEPLPQARAVHDAFRQAADSA